MGVLTASGMMADDGGSAPDVEAINDPPEQPQEPEGQEPRGEFVPTPQDRPKSRRQAATEAVIDERLKTFRDDLSKQLDAQRQIAEELRSQNARLMGQFEAMQRMPPPAQPAPAAPGPEPERLYMEAQDALEKNDIRLYHTKLREASELIAERRADEKIKAIRQEMEQRSPAPMPPEVQFLLSQHRNVALNGARGIEAVKLADDMLAFRGVPKSPARLNQAFEEAERMLSSQQAKPQASQQYGQEAAAALAGVPTSRPSASSSRQEEGVTLSPLELETARNAGMTKEQYARWKSPDKFFNK